MPAKEQRPKKALGSGIGIRAHPPAVTLLLFSQLWDEGLPSSGVNAVAKLTSTLEGFGKMKAMLAAKKDSSSE